MQVNKLSKKSLSLTLGLSVALTNTAPLSVLANGAKVEDVVASKSQDKITIGNEYISREFSIENGKILTSEIENSRANTTLVPQLGSEDFIINTIQENSDLPEVEANSPKEVLDRANWNAILTANSGTAYPATDIEKLFDGDKNTYIDSYTITGYPTSLKIDLGEVKTVSSFSYQKRPGFTDANYGKNGTMGQYKLYISEDGENWTEAGEGEFTREDFNLHQEGNLHNVGDVVYGNFDKTYESRYIRIDQLSDALGNTQEFSGAEINLYSDKYEKPEEPIAPKTAIKSSDLTIDTSSTKIEDIENGKKLTISYEPYDFNGTEYDIDMVTVLENDDHYMRSFLEIKTNNENAKIDYIDLDHFILEEGIKDTLWSHPDLEDVTSILIGKNELMLGQPIYANGMFFGSEFPAADTDVVDDRMQIRYYSGKSFEELERDNQLTTDGKFVSWQNVVGAAKGVDTDVVQTDFFEYISEIATPTDFRKQYNSWYDNMLTITDESISKSFYGTEKGLTENGVEPIDSYVVDDGWHNYRDPEFNPNISKEQAGNSMNRTGFWEFNDKFPNELYTSTELTSKFQSKFGLWLGPQGGYNFYGGFARYLEKMGTGYAQTNNGVNVCVGSDRYIKNLTSLFLDYQKRFDIDYWKLDGFALRPCTSENHDHMTGGHNNMYYTTDLWEKWTDAWETMRASRAEEGKDLFINATCYVNLSPWILQWVNTVWIQNSQDTGEAGTGSRHQQKITYRDAVYHDIYKSNQIQFPAKNIYNHEPIYGVSDGSFATTEDFRDFLFANAVRGTVFWELYYSPSIMDDEKWKVNADVLDFVENNFNVLEKAKLFGHRATEGVYGYSAWDGNEGIVSFRNPTGETKEYTLDLTDIVGVPKSVSNLKGNQVLPYKVGDIGSVSYGDSITVTLAPYETRILQYGKVDNKACEIVSAKVTGENEITIKYNERVENGEGVYSVEGNEITETKLLDDYRTVVISTSNKLQGEAKLNINGERDALQNPLTTSLTIPVYNNGKIVSVKSGEELIGGENINKKYNGNSDTYFLEMNKAYEVDTNESFKGKTDFAVSMAINTTSSNVNLLSQGEEIKLSIDEEGYVNFKVKDLNLTSKSEVTTVTEKAHGTFGTNEYVETSTESTFVGKVNDGKLHHISAVREVNGVLKVYIDGELMNSVYDKSLINQEINGGTIMVSDNNFTGVMGDIELRNSSIYYDEAKELYNSYEGSDIIEYSRENWATSACSEMNPPSGNDGPASYAIDGNESTLWHTNYRGGDTHSGNHWLSVDFGEELDFDTVNLLSRGKEINGSIKGYKLEANINGEWTVVKEGEFTDGVKEKIELDEAIKASGIKLTALSTFNGQNFAAVREISVAKKDREATEDEINELKALVKEINKEDYTKATANRYIKVAEKVNALDKINLSQLDRLRSELNKAYEGLVEARELNKTLVEAGKLIKEDYTIESWIVFEEALNHAKDLNNDIEATKEGVDEATVRLKEAINSLEKVNNEGEIVAGPVNNFEASEIAKKNVTVTWSAPESTKGLEGYILYKDGKKVAEIGLEETSYNFKGLNRHTIYNFKVAAKYSNGELSKKESITLRTDR